MASQSNSVWAIDIGNSSLKALHLADMGDRFEVIGFDHIAHGKILTSPGIKDIERDELIAMSLRQFVSNNSIGKEDFIVSVSSQNSFARFVTLPPVEEKKIPEIVKFEAAQQIPFDMNEVQWDWQLIGESGSKERKVGLFAIKNETVMRELDFLQAENLPVSTVQITPMALYNFLCYDRPDLTKSSSKASIVLNIGAEFTDLVIGTKDTVWQRSIPMGGNTFTRAISDTFKLNFEKAEKLKRTATMSKYARQILQAMKPVFTDLAGEIQRSIGFYSSSNPNSKVVHAIALGGGTKMRGLVKYLQQTLQVPVDIPDAYQQLSIDSSLSAAKFHENVSDFGVVYGLAVQGLGAGKMENNLLPKSVAKSMLWASKAKFFNLAASLILLACALALGRTFFDKMQYAKQQPVRRDIQNVISTTENSVRQLEEQKSKAVVYEEKIQKEMQLFEYRDVIPQVYQLIFSALPNAENNPQQRHLYEAFTRRDIQTIQQIPRNQRKQIFLTTIQIQYTQDLQNEPFQDTQSSSRARYQRTGQNQTFYEDDLMMDPYGAPQPAYPSYSRQVDSSTGSTGKRGFVVSIAGYTPYENPGQIFDPPNVGNNTDQWGMVTRLMNPKEVTDINIPLSLFSKTDTKHFELKIQEIMPESDTRTSQQKMPPGIGIRQIIDKSDDSTERQTVLVDPLTGEVINQTPVLTSQGRPALDNRGQIKYQTHDHWFIMNFKLLWETETSESQTPSSENESDAKDFY